MRKNHPVIVSAKALFVFYALLICNFFASAQTVTIEGTGTTSSYLYSPMYTFNAAPRSLRIAYIYSQSLLSTMPAGSNIINLQFSRNSATGTLPAGNNLKLYLMNTTATDWGTAALTWNIASATLVYDGDPSAIVGSTNGYKSFALIAPFTYTGGNIALFSEYAQVTPPLTTLNWDYNTTATQPGYLANQTKYTVNASTTMPATLSTTTANHPNIKIDYIPGSVCTSPPVAGTATVTPSTPVCQGAAVTFNLTGNSTGSGQTYQWESSANIAGPYTPVSAVLNSAAFNTTAPAASAYYRCAVTCSGNTQTSTPVLLNVNAGLAGGTYTINSALATGGTNYQSFADAVAALSCGITGAVVFNVDPASGPYNEQVIIPQIAGASATNTITFNGNGRTLQFLSTNTNERAVIKLNGADHITFDNLVINALGTTTTEYGFGIQFINDADNNTINNCQVNINTSSNSTNYAGIVMSSSATSATTTGSALCDNNIISNNTVTGGYYGMTQVGSTTAANFGNKITGNTIKEFYFYGIYVLGSGSLLIDSNTISRPARTVVSTHYGIYFTSLSVQAKVTRNRITNPFGGDLASTSTFYGIYFTAVDALSGLENVVSNNLIYNMTGAGDHYGFYNSSSDNVRYYHNTISMDGTGAGTTATTVTRAFYQITAAAGIEFRNNIITITRGGPGVKTAMYFGTAITSANIILSDRNDLYLSSGAGTEYTGFYNSVIQASLLNWQTASGQDANSVSSNPIYTDVALGNYEPTNASINDLGSPVGIIIDINGNARSATTPDLGAYEFTPAICIAPPIAGTATVGQTPICVNFPVSLSVTGNSIGLGQTYQWQTATTIGGPYSNIGNVLTNPDTTIIASSSFYYRVAVTCSGNTQFSTPVLLTVNPALAAGTYSIDQTAPASASNFISFNDAKAAMACGIDGPVVFNVVANTGPYIEQLVLDSIPGTSAVNTVTFNGNGNAIEFLSTNSNQRAVIKLNGADYIGFYNLVINAGGTTTTEYGYGVQMINNADNNTINNCTININTTSTSTANYAGVVINSSATGITTTGDSRCDNNTVSFTTITGGYIGVAVVANGSTNQVLNNRILFNTITDFYAYGIYVNGTNNILVEGNNVSRPVRDNSGTIVYGIYFTGISQNAKISKNRIHNPYGGMPGTANDVYGIYLTTVDAPAGAENIISNNALYNLNGDGTIYGIYNAGSDNAWYYHNTVSIDNTTSVSTEASRGFYQTTQASGINFRNNIVTISRGGTGAKHAIYIGTTTTTYISNYNDLYIDAGTANGFVGFTTANQATLTDWQTASTQDANSLSVDPLYTSLAAGNLKPGFAVLDDKGTPVGISTDIVSAPRSGTTPDIGAWEFAVLPCTAPPVPGTTSAFPNSNICIGTPVQLSLTGNSSGIGQTYQWQYSTSATGPWTDLGGPMLIADTIINASGVFYYRVAVTCSGNTAYSTTALVSMNPPFPAGTYTINNTLPTDYPSGTNFNSFVEAVAVMNCGISGPVVFNVTPGTYTEQVRMRTITGTSPVNTVTFQAQNGNPASVTLTYAITDAALNYVLQLDSASYIIYKNMTVTATGVTNARAIELARTASNDTLMNLVINVPVSTSTSNVIAGIVGTSLTGHNNTIKGNTITNGSSGIYIGGMSVALAPDNLVIDSNTINSSYYYGIYVSNTKNLITRKNTVDMASPRNATNYGIYATNADSAYQFVSNVVNINNLTSTTSYGMYFTSCDAAVALPGRIANNKITALNGNTGTLYGMYQTATANNNTVNNVIVLNTTGASSYGIYSTGGGFNKYYNNSVNSVASSATNNYAAYFSNTSGSGVDVRNNIFSHRGGGRALYVGSTSYVYSDYNLLYTTGANLVQSGTPAGTFATLEAWRTASSLDMNSIVYSPSFTSTANLVPNVNDPDVWAIHGRGEQLPGNDYDFNNNTRPTTVVAGVPDLGAYEFTPAIAPPVLPAIPAAPAAGATQVFMFGTDTVSKITWKPASVVPSAVSVRRYSGVIPPGMAPTAKHMYFYTDVDVTASSAPNYDLKQYYIDPWQGLIPREAVTRLGRTNASAAWIMDAASSADTVKNVLSRDTLNFLDKFTGMTDSTIQAPPPPPNVISIDSSNAGKRFWVAYGHHQGFSSNGQDMVLYLSATQAANVQVRVNGTGWSRNYSIAANSAIVSDIIPKGGIADARLLDEGLSDRAISIESDVPIVAYAHIYQGANSGAGMLLPVGVYGYEYISLNSAQYYASDCYSWFYVIADRDSTLVEITPVVATKGGRPANVPFTVYLNKGQVYQVMGTTSGSTGTDMTGSKIRSVPNASGKCYPIAVFSGSSRTALCNTTNGDNFIQQVFPSQAWGRKFLTFATASSTSNTAYNSNKWRVLVKDPATVVLRNGTPLTGLVTPGNYYEFGITGGTGASTASYIEADKPVLVAQYMLSTSGTGCSGLAAPGGNGDPEMIYISPLEQGIKQAIFYNTDESAITSNYVNLVLPTTGLTSLTIDGANTFTDVFAHPNLAGYTCIRHNLGATAGQHIVQSDSAFTAITYGLGSVESYGYNAGTLVKNLNARGTISNVFAASGTTAPYTCKGTPFKMTMRVSVKPTQITWNLNQVPGLSPNANVIQNNPTPADSVLVNGQWFYIYSLPLDYTINNVGQVSVPITFVHPSIEGCNSSLDFTLLIDVIPAPVTDFTYTFNGCITDVAQFNGTMVTSNGVPVSSWNWNFGDATTSTLQNPTKQWAAAGTYNVMLRGIANDGCIDDSTKTINVGTPPVVTITPDSLASCNNSIVTFTVQNPVTGVIYNWYDAVTGGNIVHAGNSYTFTVNGPVSYYVEAVAPGGCLSTSRKRVKVIILPNLVAPVVTVDSAGTNMLRFRWSAVPNATGYEVSADNGATWTTPSSGLTGLTHTVTGLQVNQTVTLIVRALGGCLPAISQPVTGQTVTDQVYIPNTFTPNGDGLNDVLRVYSNVIRDMHFAIFNQWGEKIFESRTQSVTWDGTHKGKPQPSGVYMYVCDMTLADGQRIQRKGSINLVR
ncbi:MAG: gliding motility-associated C-terminal domain-containing protein [Chitinophagaceae bacterium]|nr:gliding motility-associated C-terminal domain-containing protein [Chitinophagaceae bacterium]